MIESAIVNRRDFIKVVTAAGTGLVLEFSLPSALRGQLAVLEPDETFTPNAWLRIDTQGVVTITVAKSDMGQGVRTALPMIVAEELDADWSMVRIEQAIADGKYGGMGTGGSTSVRTSWERLRKAGATAREMLIAAAAATWRVDPGACMARNGAVVHEKSGRSLKFGELAAKASTLPVPNDPPLKDPKDFRIVGRRIPGIDTPSKTDGSAQFGIDVRVPDMLYASVARCPVFGGTAAAVDASAAKAIKGVRTVVQIESGVAAVADSTWTAFQARDALKITWKEGVHADLSSDRIRAMFVQAASETGAVAEKEGDVSTALRVAAKKVHAVYEAPFLAHATMEPMNCTAFVQKDRCEVWAPTQNPQGVRRDAANVSGLPEEKVTVHTMLLGGGFGRKYANDCVMDALQVSKAVDAPVKVTWTREDDIQHDLYRPASYHVLDGGIDKSGALLAFSHRIVAPSIGEQQSPGSIKGGLDKGAVEGAVELPYAIPNFLVEYVMANTGVPIWFWRSVYPSQNVFAVECFIDELAHAAGRDPVDFRLAMMGKSPRARRVLEVVAEKSSWGKPLPTGRFRGVAFSPPAFFQTPVAQVAEVSIESGNLVRVHRVVCAVDCGIAVNPDIIEAQIEGGIVYGLTAALYGRIRIDKGRAVESNFDDYPLLTIDRMPQIDVHIIKSDAPPSGTGEPGLPAITPAVANAVSAATGKRMRSLPIQL